MDDAQIEHILQLLRGDRAGGGLNSTVLLDLIQRAMEAGRPTRGLENAQAMHVRNQARRDDLAQRGDHLRGQAQAAAMHARNAARQAANQVGRQDASAGQPIRRNPVLDAMKSSNASGGPNFPPTGTNHYAQGIGGPAPQGTTPRTFESFLPPGMKRPSPFNTPSQPTVVSGPAGTPPPKNHYTFGGFGNSDISRMKPR